MKVCVHLVVCRRRNLCVRIVDLAWIARFMLVLVYPVYYSAFQQACCVARSASLSYLRNFRLGAKPDGWVLFPLNWPKFCNGFLEKFPS